MARSLVDNGRDVGWRAAQILKTPKSRVYQSQYVPGVWPWLSTLLNPAVSLSLPPSPSFARRFQAVLRTMSPPPPLSLGLTATVHKSSHATRAKERLRDKRPPRPAHKVFFLRGGSLLYLRGLLITRRGI